MNLFRWLIQPDPRGSYYSAWDLLDQRHDDCAECLREEMENNHG